MTLQTGEIKRKDDAAAWAAQRLPPDLAAVLDRARELYLAGQYGPWNDMEPAVAQAAQYIASEIRRWPRR